MSDCQSAATLPRTPKLLFTAVSLAFENDFRRFDVHPDGKRFLMETSGGVDANRLEVIFNWPVELARAQPKP